MLTIASLAALLAGEGIGIATAIGIVGDHPVAYATNEGAEGASGHVTYFLESSPAPDHTLAQQCVGTKGIGGTPNYDSLTRASKLSRRGQILGLPFRQLGSLQLNDSAVAHKSRISSSTRIDPAGFLHKSLQTRPGFFAMSNIPQRSRPFADRLIGGGAATRAANDRSKWICILVERQISKSKGMPQKLLGPSPYFVMLDDFKHRL
jgi:hypothetical protein